MKSGWLASLLVAFVLFVTVDSHRGFRRHGYGWGRSPGNHGRPMWNHGRRMGPWHGDFRRPWNHHMQPWNDRNPMGPWFGGNQGRARCNQQRPRNCSDFIDGTCVSCDDGFALKSFNFFRCSRTICVPCGWRLKQKHPDLYLQQCGGSCGRGCVNCDSPGMCLECKQGLKLFTPPNSNITKCIRYCPVFYKLNKKSAPKCELKEAKQDKACGKLCMECSESGVCLKCIEPMRLIQIGDRTSCRGKCPSQFRGRLDPENQRTICEKPAINIRKEGGDPMMSNEP